MKVKGHLSLWQRIKNQARRRAQFASLASWAADGYVRVLNWMPAASLPGRHRSYRIRPAGLAQPVLVRPNTTDIACMEEIFLTREYATAADLCAAPVRRILDLGGNVGFSVRLWQEIFPQASILVVEPEQGNLQQLRANMALGPSPGSAEARQAFAAAAGGTASIDRSGGEYGFRMAAGTPHGAGGINKVPVSELVKEAAGPEGRVDLLKCDVEGAEAEIFAACRPWIGRVAVAVVETHPPYSPEKLLADLAASGVELVRHRAVPKSGGMWLVWVRVRPAGETCGSAP